MKHTPGTIQYKIDVGDKNDRVGYTAGSVAKKTKSYFDSLDFSCLDEIGRIQRRSFADTPVSDKNKAQAHFKITSNILAARECMARLMLRLYEMDSKEEVIEYLNTHNYSNMITCTFKDKVRSRAKAEKIAVNFLNLIRSKLYPKKYREFAQCAVAITEQHEDGSWHLHISIFCPYLANTLWLQNAICEYWEQKYGFCTLVTGNYAINRTINYYKKDEKLKDQDFDFVSSEGEPYKFLPKSPRLVVPHPYVAKMAKLCTFKFKFPLHKGSDLDLLRFCVKLTNLDVKALSLTENGKDSGAFHHIRVYASKITDYAPNALEDRFSYIFKPIKEAVRLRIEQRQEAYKRYVENRSKFDVLRELKEFNENLVDSYNYRTQIYNAYHTVRRPTVDLYDSS